MIELDNHKRTLIDNNKGTNIHTKKKIESTAIDD